MAERGADTAARPRGWGTLALALAALAACWNPLAAPFGLLVGIAATVLSIRALRRTGQRRRVLAAALASAALAVIASVVMLALTVGVVGSELSGEPVVKGRSLGELEEALSGAAARTRGLRERASQELDSLVGKAPAAAPARQSPLDGGVPTDGGHP